MSQQMISAPLDEEFSDKEFSADESGSSLSQYYTQLQKSQLNPTRIPHHIAIIPDGNRRWAKKHYSSPEIGHREGAESLMEIVKAAKELGIKIISFFAFSTENWGRLDAEILSLMSIFSEYLTERCEEMIANGVKVETIGDLTKLPPFLNQVIQKTKQATSHCKDIQLVLAFNYGSRNELCRAFKSILEDYEQKQLTKDEIDEKMISNYLDTAQWKDPDLLIRTSGEFRISNFLLWQLSYTEIHVAPVFWPEFTPQHLLNAILDYQTRERRWGKGG